MAIGVVDVALWDIVGKVAGLPVHRLLGTCRHRVPAYFSSGHHDAPEDYAEEAVYWRDQGWKGYKLHPPSASWDARPRGPIEADIDGVPRRPRGGRRRHGAHARRELGLHATPRR